MTSIWDTLASAAWAHSHLRYSQPQRGSVSLDELLARAERAAGALSRMIRPSAGEQPKFGVLLANGEPWVRTFLAVTRLGAVPVPLPLPQGFRGTAGYCDRIGRVARDASLDAIIFDDSAGPMLAQLADTCAAAGFIHCDELAAARRPGPLPDPAGFQPGQLAVLQYTSGSTSAPKGVMLSQQNVVTALHAITQGVAWDPAADVMGVWIPLSHDMGLFSMLAALARGSGVCLWTPGEFVRRPGRWLREFAASPATALAAPNFSYDYLCAAARDDPRLVGDLDLSGWRVAFNGAETVQRRTIDSFGETFGPSGFDHRAMHPVYGMAEATLPVTFPKLGPGPRFRDVDRGALSPGARAEPAAGQASRRIVCVGHPVTGIELRIADERARPLSPLTVGEVQVRGAAVTAGYLGKPAAEQPFTADGWLRTGDLGFLGADGLYLTGRAKDMITVKGQNYYAEDVEELVRGTPGVDRRHCAAVSWSDQEGRESILVLVETRKAGEAAEALARVIHHKIATELGLAAVEVRAIEPHSLPYTSSGKVKRQETRRLAREHARAGKRGQDSVRPEHAI